MENIKYFLRPILFFVLMIYLLLQYPNLNAQPFDYDSKNFKIEKLHYENSSGEKGLTTYLTNPDGIVYKAIWQQLDTNRFSINRFIYKKDKLVELARIFSDTIRSKKKFIYMDNGLLKKEIFERSDGKNGSAEYIYNDKKQLIQLNCNGLNGWFNGVIDYHYKNKKKTYADILMNHKKVGKISFTYSPEGNLVKEYWDFPDRWNQTLTYEYANRYNINWTNSNPLLQIPSGYKITEEDYTYNGKTGGPSHFKYDTKGHLTEKIFERSDTFKTITNFEYDKKNLLIRSIRNYSDGKKAVFNFKYNNGNQIVEKTYERTDSIAGREAFLYDTNGRLIAARYDNMDSWLTGNLYFKHDKFDQIVSAEFYADAGYTAKIHFKQNNDGLTTEIKWDFSFGAYQTYNFKYTFEP